MKDTNMEKVIAELQLQYQECVDQTGCEPSCIEDYDNYLYCEEFGYFLDKNCDKDFSVGITDVLNYLLKNYRAEV